MEKPLGDITAEDESSSTDDIIPEITNYVIQEYDSKIKFRSLDQVHNFIFLKNKNSILVLEPIRLIYLYSFHHDDIIVDFNVSKDNSLILCSPTKLERYKLDTPNLSDNQIKIKYELYKSTDVDHLQKLSISHLGDVIVAINIHRIIKIFDMDLNIIKTLNLIVNFIPKDMEMFPLNYFNLNYDTKTILLIKYNLEKVSFVYRIRADESENEFGIGEQPKEYAEKIISFNEKIIYAKEYLKNFSMYINYQDSSIMFVLTQGLNFLILQKFYEFNEKTYDSIPNLRTLLYINLSNKSDIKNDKYISFSLLYDNENPIFKTDFSQYKDLQSGILDMDPWRNKKNKNTLSEDDETFLNYNEKNFKNISCDYILFNFQENVFIYKVNGLQSPPFNNPWIDSSSSLSLDNNYESSFTLLKAIKTFDRKYSIFFKDKYNNIRKFILDNKSSGTISNEMNNINLEEGGDDKLDKLINISLKESNYAFTMYNNIINADYNHGNRKTFIHQKIDNDDLIILINFRLKFFKMLIFENLEISNIHWVKNSNFLIFSYYKKILNELYGFRQRIGIIYIYSKYLDESFNRINEKMIDDNFIKLDIEEIFKQDINNIYNIFLDNEFLTKRDELSEEKNRDENEDNKNNISFNDVSSNLLIKTENDLYHCFIKLSHNTNKDNKKEYNCEFILNYSLEKKIFNNPEDINYWKKKKFIFNSNEIFYTIFDEKFGIISILKIDKSLKTKIIYQSVSVGKLLDLIFFFNNYIIYISEFYINTYDIINRTFYRIRNDYIKESEIKSGQSCIHLSFFGVYLRLSLLSAKGIKIIRIPRNKNLNEAFSFNFKYKFQIGNFNMINYSNKMIIFNETQMEEIDKISNLEQSLLNDSDNNSNYKQLVLLNSNAGSLFDNETFMDYFLSDNENIIKMILNLFCYEYKELKLNEAKEKYQNSKLIPNYLVSFDFIKKIIFDENFHSKIISDNKFNVLNFNKDIDDQKNNPIQIMCSKNSNINHMKYVYDLLSDETTKNIDSFTKYFMLKMHHKKKDFERKTFKLSTVDLCWISLITNQSDILNFICHGKVETINWEIMTMFNIPLWIKSDAKLKELLVEVAKNNYKQQFVDETKNQNNNTNKIKLRNYTENIALYLYLAGQQKMIIDYFNKEPHNEKIMKFVMRDFKIKKNRNAAHENADTLMNKKKYIYAAYFYLLSDDIRSALDMVYEKMKDINLTVCMLRLVDSKYGNDSWKKYYSLEKIYKDLFINFGTVFRDPYLVMFGYLGQGKYDLALEYILNYDNEYSFEDKKEMFQDIDDYLSNLNILRKSFALNVFDYRMILFAKSLEKVYQIKYDETNKTVLNIGNTGFDEDDWDMDNLNGGNDEEEEEEDNNKNINQNNNDKKENENNEGEYKLKKIEVNYENLIKLCLINSLKQGTIFTPIIYLFKTAHKDEIRDLPQSIKDILKSLICDRIVLDTINSPPNVEIMTNFFDETDKFFEYIEKEGVNSKIDMFKQINYDYILLHEYQNAYQSSFKSNQIIITLISIHDFVELILNNNCYIIVNFNFFENINLKKIDDNLSKLLILFSFIRKLEENYTEPTDEKGAYDEIEKNIYIFRIIFMIYFYILFISKILLKYHYVSEIYDMINKMVKENYNDLANFNRDKAIIFIDDITNIISKIKKRINGEITSSKKIFIDEGLSFFILLVNLSLLKELSSFVEKNTQLKKLTNSELSKMASKYINKNIEKEKTNTIKPKENSDHYFYEDFKFINYLFALIHSYLDNFEINIEKYISKYMQCDIRYAIHEELKKFFIKKSPIKFSKKEKNLKIIKYEYLFSNKEEEKFNERFAKFEKLFNLNFVICKYITFLSKKFKYEIRKEGDTLEVNSNLADPSLPPSNYTMSSINIVSSLFHKVGYEVFNLNENLIINDFCCNNCDMSQMAVSFGQQGNIKINFLNNLINKKKTDSLLSLMEKDELDNWETTYKYSYVNDYYTSLEKQIQESYNEVLSILYHGILMPRKTFIQFPQSLKLPPKYFNSIPSSEYLENISIQQKTRSNTVQNKDTSNIPNLSNINTEYSYSKILLPHPQLPIYLSSNNKGVISVYSFSPFKNISSVIDEYYIEKKNSEGISKPVSLGINKMKFNSYGDTLIACDTEGSVYTWNFDHSNNRKIPENSIPQTSGGFYCDDCCFLNNTGIIATTGNNLDERPKSILFDLLLPPKKRKIGEIPRGGDRILPISSDATFLIGNNEKPGNISFVDIRKMEIVNSFQAHQNGCIKDIKLSENENFLVTYGEDLFVKIWDLNNKTNPLLIESFQPFGGKNEKKSTIKLQIYNGFLFASKDNSIKLLRNYII